MPRKLARHASFGLIVVISASRIAQDLDLRKARAAEVAPGFARHELLPGDDLADLVVRVAHLLYVVGLELPFEEILLESFAAHVLKVALHARLHLAVFVVNDRSGGDIAGEKQGPGIRRKRERQPLHGTGDAPDLRDDAVGDN